MGVAYARPRTPLCPALYFRITICPSEFDAASYPASDPDATSMPIASMNPLNLNKWAPQNMRGLVDVRGR